MNQAGVNQAGVNQAGVKPSVAATAIFSVLLLLAHPQQTGAQPAREVVRDDFSVEGFSPQNWYVCRRPENAMSVVAWPGVGRAARLVANPLTRKVLGLSEPLDEKHAACMDGRGKYTPDGTQRAELWEKRALVEPFGRETWIQFEFMVASPPSGAAVPHLVIGQLKADGKHSPVLAQRFADRHFMVTLGQDNDNPDRHPEDMDCRVIVAHDASLLARFPRPPEFLAGSVGQDSRDLVHAPGAPRGCKRDLAVDARELLPSPFGMWVRMTYRIRPGLEKGLLEVWADGRLIAKAAGRIGYRDSVGGSQYFKFGPYSDSHPPLSFDVKAYLAHYRRAPTCAQLGDPSAAECPAQ